MGRMIDLVERIMLKQQQEAKMKGLFYIPETKEEISKLINEIISRNQGGSALEIMYAVELTKAFYSQDDNEEVA